MKDRKKNLINMLDAAPIEIKYACYSGLFSSRQPKNKYLEVISKCQLQYKVSLHLQIQVLSNWNKKS